MRFFQIAQWAGSLLLAGILFGGCSRHGDGDGHGHEEGHEHHDEHAEHEEEDVSFSETKGLHVPKSTADFIGLKIVDVEEQKLASTFRFSAKVYRPSANGKKLTLASAFLKQSNAKQLHVGQSLKISADDSVLIGRIAELHRDMEKATGQIEVLLEIDDPQNFLSMGSHVEAAVPTGKEENIIGIPNTALLRTAEGNFVYTVSGEHLVRSEVRVGEVGDALVEITEGLYAGDQVVASPVMTLWMAELQAIRGGASCADGH